MIAVIGLGYVGLPLAEALSKHYKVLGFDTDREKLKSLRGNGNLTLTYDRAALKNNFITMYIICVPTPVDKYNKPDLECLTEASHTVGNARMDNPGAIVVYESTVYPGCTEDYCKPILERYCKDPVRLGYSPERINPGDKEHTLANIWKIVAGDTSETLGEMVEIYGRICDVYCAQSIRVAEAAKIIENVQRDVNIGLMNELAMVFDKMNIPMTQVLEAAKTKWNFLDFKPGLVGGHCIGVDPYYLTYAAQGLALHPEMILAGRRVNDGMASYIAKTVMKRRPRSIGILGATYKPNVGDFRNSKAMDLINELSTYSNVLLMVHDPYDPQRNLPGYRSLDKWKKCHVLIKAVDHDEYKDLDLKAMLTPRGRIFDIANWSFK